MKATPRSLITSFTAHSLPVVPLTLSLILGLAVLAPCVPWLASVQAVTSRQDTEEGSNDRTLSPYFFVNSEDPSTDRMPLKTTNVDVRINGFIADVKVTQVYENQGQNPLEAVYVFPASTRAAVHAMKMTIGERVLVAKVQERGKAREQYEQAKAEGKTASLLEQQRPNVFQMNVANILPGDVIRVELEYTELLTPTEQVYEFIYPTVVGPRYSNQPQASVDDRARWVANPYLHEGEPPTYSFGLNIDLSTGVPIQDARCDSHKVDIDYQAPNHALISLSREAKWGGNRDFILKYRLSGRSIQSGLILHEGEEENYFLLLAEPPNRIAPEQIPPREYLFVVDVSGSMHGFPLDVAKTLMKDLLDDLRPTDFFNVLFFAGGSSVLSEQPLAANSANINRAVRMLENQRGGGGTELISALRRAFSVQASSTRSRTIVVVTDGYVNVEKETFNLIRNNLDQANLFAFGIGSSVNRYLIEGMARAGLGEPFIVTRASDAGAQAKSFKMMIEQPVLTDIQVDFGSYHVYDVEPPHVPDLLAQRPIMLFGKWKGPPQGTIRLTGHSGEGPYAVEIPVASTANNKDHPALRYLWARHRIAMLSDYNRGGNDPSLIRKITELGLTYNLLTDYTSFIAIDHVVRRRDGKLVTVKQPLPLPEGVSDLAVAKEMVASTAYLGRAAPALTPSPVRQVLAETATKRDEEKNRSNAAQQPYRMVVEQIDGKGRARHAQVRQELKRHAKAIGACLKEYSQSGPVKITVELIVSASGHVESIRFVSAEGLSASIRKCFLKALLLCQFEPTDGLPSSEWSAQVVLVFTPAMT